MFSKETYIKRREKLKKQFDNGLLLFLGNDESSMNYADNTYRFRQDSTFLYYFGINHPGLIAVIDIDEDKEIIFGNDYTIDDIVWMGSQKTIAQRSAEYGIVHTSTAYKGLSYLQNAQNKNRKIRYLPPYRAEHKLKLSAFFGIPVEKISPSIEFITEVGEQRNIKSTEEITEIEEAVNITSDMHRTAMRYAKAGMTEAQVAAKVYEVALAAGGDISFPIIATINGQTLHNHYHGNVIKEGDLFLLDAGAENCLGYAGDMSSTFPVSKKFTDRQKEIYQISLNAHEAAIHMLKPGINFKEVHIHAAKTIVKGMKEIGLMKGNEDDAVEAGAHALFFPCGLGHLMGLDVHDMENLGEQYVGYEGRPKSTQFGLKSLRLGRELKPGFVITIEPGIYFIPELIDMWKSQKKFTDFILWEKVETYKDFGGCRNEEDLLITETGYRILGKPLAKTIEDVEKERTYAI